MVRLAKEMELYVFRLALFKGLVFIFDHDKAGQDAATLVRNNGYKKRVLTLDPKEHPGACASKQVVIEDLLSLEIQKQFFNNGNVWCSVDYEDGTIARFHWHYKSKDKLRDYVCRNGTWDDVKEIVGVLIRIRKALGLPCTTASLHGVTGQRLDRQ